MYDKEYYKRYYKKNREKILKRSKEYYQKNKKELLRKKKEAYRLDPAKLLKTQKQWRERKKKDPNWVEKQRKRKREYRRRQVINLIRRFGGKCERCGYSEHPVILQFHHRTPVRRQTNNYPHSTRSEILHKHISQEDFELLCPNCHCEIHLEMEVELQLEMQSIQLEAWR